MKKFIRNSYIKKIIGALSDTKTVILTGARQVGKTTILKQIQDRVQSQQPCLYLNCEELFDKKFGSLKEFVVWIHTEFGLDATQP